MSFEQLKSSTLPRALSSIVDDAADLFRKEVRLAKAEFAENISAQIRAAIWMVAAAFIGLVAALLIVQGIVFWIASAGLALHWASFLVAGLLLVAGGIAYSQWKSAGAAITPDRTITQIKRDISTIKERLS
jgi:hypothetical protein